MGFSNAFFTIIFFVFCLFFSFVPTLKKISKTIGSRLFFTFHRSVSECLVVCSGSSLYLYVIRQSRWLWGRPPVVSPTQWSGVTLCWAFLWFRAPFDVHSTGRGWTICGGWLLPVLFWVSFNWRCQGRLDLRYRLFRALLSMLFTSLSVRSQLQCGTYHCYDVYVALQSDASSG